MADTARVPAQTFQTRVRSGLDSLEARLRALEVRAERLDAPPDAPLHASLEELHEQLNKLRSDLDAGVPSEPAARNAMWRRYDAFAREVDELWLRSLTSREAFLDAVDVRLARQQARLDSLQRHVDGTPPRLRPGLPSDMERLRKQHQELQGVAERARNAQGMDFDEQRDLLSLQVVSLSAQIRTLERTLRRADASST